MLYYLCWTAPCVLNGMLMSKGAICPERLNNTILREERALSDENHTLQYILIYACG